MLNVIMKHDHLLYLKKLFALASADKSEVMTYPIYSITKENDVVTLVIEDLITPTQVVTGVTCEALSKDEALQAKVPLAEIVTLHHAIARCKSLSLNQDSSWGWIHLHPNGITPSPSGTDTNQQKTYLGIEGEDFQRDMTLMIIFNEGVDTQSNTCEVWFKSSHRIFDDNILKIQGNLTYDYFTSEKSVEEITLKAEKDYKERVKAKVSQYQPYYAGFNYDYETWPGKNYLEDSTRTITGGISKTIEDDNNDDKFFTSLNKYSSYQGKESTRNEPVYKHKSSWFSKHKEK